MAELFWTTICPILGLVVANAQVVPPLNAVLICRKARDLGPLNPTPWAMGLVNCLGVMIYGALLQNAYIMLAVGPGVMINFFACTSAIGLMGAKGQHESAARVENIVLSGLLIWLVLGFIIGAFMSLTTSGQLLSVQVAGYVCSCTTIGFYCAPLSKLTKVVRSRDAASLYLPALLVNMLCSALWACYGFFGIDNTNIYVPNSFAFLVTSLQLSLKIRYPSGKSVEVDPIELMSLTDSAIASAAAEAAAKAVLAAAEVAAAVVVAGYVCMYVCMYVYVHPVQAH
eukprot:CAMPEP_0173353310 /NCGR_PEP_ID=MMETSP1144-20121109/16541_1 /TAXON_ID=483371 /ORGANISM="non described non described, Strain CCMP2298" /LENGTH=283 /DNA_ID=CAMNT_0014301699 /DNA_START=52 /DNA_END=904 /DNA_ORIENTATION=+